MSLLSAAGVGFDLEVPVLIVGAGACGLTAALAAKDLGVVPLVLERDPMPGGSTALSSGMIPACDTRWQRTAAVDDDPQRMAADIQRKAGGEVEPTLLKTVCEASGPTLEWLADRHGIEFVLVDGFLYPGHSRHRMHAPAAKTGRALIDSLAAAAERAEVNVVTRARAQDLYMDAGGRIRGLVVERPDGSTDRVGCNALILACNGYAGNPDLVRCYIPEIANALYFGHPGNRGDALLWGQALGADIAHLGAYQGHGSVATPHGILITWAIMMEGGIQVNSAAQRFSNEHQGYSEQAVSVLAQPGRVAWNIYDQRRHELGLGFEDYRSAWALGAIKSAYSAERLGEVLGLPATQLAATITASQQYARGYKQDPLGRDFTAAPELQSPYYGVKVTGALFHTQGGLRLNSKAQVLLTNKGVVPNLFAGGGAACGLSGSRVSGYLSGNGLLSAVVLGRIAGQQAARCVMQSSALPGCL